MATPRELDTPEFCETSCGVVVAVFLGDDDDVVVVEGRKVTRTIDVDVSGPACSTWPFGPTVLPSRSTTTTT